MRLSEKARHAFMLGALCSVSYFAVYIARNILGAVTPNILASGAFNEADIGTMSSVYFASYAIGQLINGFVGDRIKAKYMISGGLILAGITNFIFPYMSGNVLGATAVYGLTGFSLAMIYAPMTKIVSENTEPIYAVRCSFGYTFASFFATPAAGLLATFLAWGAVFTVSSSVLALMGVLSFVFFTVFEHRGIVKYGQYESNAKEQGSIKTLFAHSIVRFTFISIITGVVRTSVVFWLPTYINQHLGFSEKESTGIYTVAGIIISLVSLVAIVVYEFFGRRRDFTIVLMLAASVLFFFLTYLVASPWLNIIFIVLAITTSDGASSIVWSVYCPSLRDTGRVSTATGFLDFVSYMAAAVANKVFPGAVSSIGWGNLILVWCGIVVFGLIASIPYKEVAHFIRNRGITSCER